MSGLNTFVDQGTMYQLLIRPQYSYCLRNLCILPGYVIIRVLACFLYSVRADVFARSLFACLAPSLTQFGEWPMLLLAFCFHASPEFVNVAAGTLLRLLLQSCYTCTRMYGICSKPIMSAFVLTLMIMLNWGC